MLNYGFTKEKFGLLPSEIIHAVESIDGNIYEKQKALEDMNRKPRGSHQSYRLSVAVFYCVADGGEHLALYKKLRGCLDVKYAPRHKHDATTSKWILPNTVIVLEKRNKYVTIAYQDFRQFLSEDSVLVEIVQKAVSRDYDILGNL